MRNLRTALVAALVALALVATGAYAGAKITGAQIENGTIGYVDLKPKVRKAIEAPGPAGPRGEQGPQGPAGCNAGECDGPVIEPCDPGECLPEPCPDDPYAEACAGGASPKGRK